MTAEDIFRVVLKDKAFYGDRGGITLSGGEPLLHAQECIELLHLVKENGISTAIETSGYFDQSYIPRLAKLTDLFIWDFKDGNTQRHIKNTGLSNEIIIKNLFLTDRQNSKILLRSVMVKGLNMDDSHLKTLAETVSRLGNCIGVELLAYHAYGGSKNEQLGYEDNGRKEWIPSTEEMGIVHKRLQHIVPVPVSIP